MTECEELALAIRAPRGATLETCREIVKEKIPDETETVIDNVSYALFRSAHSYPCCCEICERDVSTWE